MAQVYPVIGSDRLVEKLLSKMRLVKRPLRTSELLSVSRLIIHH